MSRATCWCFTLNNPEAHGPLPETWPGVKFMIYQQERGELDTVHLQGYVEFTTAKRVQTLKNINQYVHWEVRRGSRQQAIEYCMKEDTRVEDTEPVVIGDMPTFDTAKEKKEKTSLLVKRMIDDGLSDKQIADEHFGYYVQSHRGLSQYRLLNSKERDYKTVITVIYGPTGTGKSMWCDKNLKSPYWKVKGKWWDNYDQQSVVVIDEFYGWMAYDEMLRLCDRYPFLVESKGKTIQFNSRLIFITSNKEPKDWYPNMTDISHLIRRIENIWEKPTLDGDFIVKKGVHPTFLLSGFQTLCHNNGNQSAMVPQSTENLSDESDISLEMLSINNCENLD